MRKYTFAILSMTFLACTKQQNLVGIEIDGKFDVEGKANVAKIIQTKFGNGSIEEGKSNDYVVTFNDSIIKPLSMSCSCNNLVLVNEGDLNNDGIDEISISSISNNHSIVSLDTYSVASKRFSPLLRSIIGVKKEVKHEDLQNFISKDKGNIIQYSYFNGIIVNKNGMSGNKIEKKLIKIESLN